MTGFLAITIIAVYLVVVPSYIGKWARRNLWYGWLFAVYWIPAALFIQLLLM